MEAGAWLLQKDINHATAAAASAVPFLRLFGDVLGGYYLVRSALVAHADLVAKQGDAHFLASKIVTARFYATHILPTGTALSAIVRRGAGATLDARESTF